MSVVLDTPYDKICEEFDEIQPFWRERGVTSESILKYANKHGVTTTVLYQDRLLAKYNPPDRKHAKAMTYQIEGKHALFFKNPRCMIFREPLKKSSRKIRGIQKSNIDLGRARRRGHTGPTIWTYCAKTL